jgi:dolichol-phosphate mannosyltransferase
MLYDLAIVMPVYNEQACINAVVESWITVLSNLNIDFRYLILNDGSTDRTKEALAVFKKDRRIEIIHKQNTGHGPSILLGYQKAVQIAEWVFQCDSDDEMKADCFPELWENRTRYHALFGKRKDRSQTLSRRFITICSRMITRLLYGPGIVDVNTPFRLIRSTILKRIVCQIPEDTFAPNIIISGALSKMRAKIYEHQVPHENRKTGKASLLKLKLWRLTMKAFWQTLSYRPVVAFIDEQTNDTSGINP